MTELLIVLICFLPLAMYLVVQNVLSERRKIAKQKIHSGATVRKKIMNNIQLET